MLGTHGGLRDLFPDFPYVSAKRRRKSLLRATLHGTRVYALSRNCCSLSCRRDNLANFVINTFGSLSGFYQLVKSVSRVFIPFLFYFIVSSRVIDQQIKVETEMRETRVNVKILNEDSIVILLPFVFFPRNCVTDEKTTKGESILLREEGERGFDERLG